MRLITPIDQLCEAEPLLQAGADELYGGYVPIQWLERFGLLASLNQRSFAAAQIATFADLEQIVDRCRQADRDFALTLNAPFYSQQQRPMLLEYIAEVSAAGVAHIILADLGLLRGLKKEFPQLSFHASTLAHLGNSAAINFYQREGIKRVVLPRHLNVAEIEQIVANVELPCDAFLLVGKCPNTEGFCTFHHSSEDKIWPCEIDYQVEAISPETAELQAAMDKQQSWATTNRRHGCGLCAIPALVKAGVSGLKLVGRGAPLLRKVKNLQLVKEFLQLAATGLPFNQYQQRALAAHQQHFGIGCNENVCYYPEFYPES
jgi:putative protease